MNNLQILMAERIKKRVEKILASDNTVDDCVMIISYAYQWVEAADSKHKSNFFSIIFYRNWLFHIKLTRRNIPEKLKEIFRQFSISESEQNSADRVAELLSTKKLRNELKIIFKNIQCNFPILDSLSQWKQFMVCVYSELLNKPLEIKSIINILDKPWGAREYLLPKRLVLVNEGNQILFEVQIYSITIDVSGKSSDETPTKLKVCGNFPLDENCENFLKD